MDNRLKVFLSHSAGDASIARAIRNLLSRQLNVRVLTDNDLPGGDDWESKVRNELAASDVVMALLTPKGLRSDWMFQEIGAAWGLGKPIIPVVTSLDLLKSVPIQLLSETAIEIDDLDTDEGAHRFVSGFEQALLASNRR